MISFHKTKSINQIQEHGVFFSMSSAVYNWVIKNNMQALLSFVDNILAEKSVNNRFFSSSAGEKSQ